jgi:hypothetical protein
MKKSLFLIAVLLFAKQLASQTDSSVIISEVMFNPISGNNEFIELYNLSSTQSVNLSGWKIKYYTSTPDQIINAGFGTVLPPNSYAIIFENDYDLTSGIYSGLVPSNALILKIADNSFGTSGMANTTSRPVWLLRANNDTIDAYTYSANNSTSFSDEKIIMNRDSSQTNWANSLIANGTPGFKNSVSPSNYDLQLSSLRFNPEFPVIGSNVDVIARVKNLGILSAQNFSVRFYNDINFDSTAQTNELIFQQSFSSLASSDSITVTHTMISPQVGTYQIIALVIFNEDENPNNNRKIGRFVVSPPGAQINDIVVNEIMYAPTSPQPEWVELFNKSSNPINLKRWRLFDATSSVVITTQDFILQPDSFVVITADSSILNYFQIPSRIIKVSLPALNNNGDAVVIKDSIGTVIDSLYYLPSWGGSSGGRSLERVSKDILSIEPTNWKTSVSPLRATPGKINSVTPKDYDLAITSFKSEKSFAIIGEEILFKVTIKNVGLNFMPTSGLSLYRDANQDSIPQANEFIKQVSVQSLNINDSTTLTINTDVFDEGLNNYILKLQSLSDDDTTNNIAFASVNGVAINEVRNDLVINEIMYAPQSPEPEWIEIYNRSNKTINLFNYKIADAVDTQKVITTNIILQPEEFLVIAKDSTIFNLYQITSKIWIRTFPSLNNSDDKIILLDSLNRVIDSLQYFSRWGGSNEKSLERLSTELSSTDSSNWKTSISKFKATPGLINSITKKNYDISVSDIYFNPKFPVAGNNVSVSAVVKNVGKNSANFSLQLFEDTDLDSIPDLLRETKNQINVNLNDSIVLAFDYQIINLQNERGFYVKAIYTEDQDTSNNYYYKKIQPGFDFNSIVINEIMFAPIGGEPEWIELYNRTDFQINLKGWKVSDVITTPTSTEIKNDFVVQPKSYVVISKDTSIVNYHRIIPAPILKLNFASLNNDIDGVVLRDNRGLTVDSVLYSNQWGGTNGYSLERINVAAPSNLSSNWASSIDNEQSTPGRVNSRTPKQNDLVVSDLLFDPRFPTLGENISLSAKVKNFGLTRSSTFLLRFYVDSDSNNVVDQLIGTASGGNVEASDSVIIACPNRINNLTKKLLVAAEVFYQSDEDTLNNFIEKFIEPGFAEGLIKISEIMYNPADGKPEWIEFYNNSSDSINIKNWSVSDILTTPTKGFITNQNIFIKQNEYFIITKDTSFNRYYPNVTSKIFYTNFGTLGNTSDGVVIYDFRNGIIDSLFYRSNWGNKKDVSLERISYTDLTNDSTNWTLSLSNSGSTPGRENSINNVPSYPRNSVVINEIMYEPDIDNSEFIEFYNVSDDSINIGGWFINDENNNKFRLSNTNYMIPPKSFFLLAADSTVVNKYGLQSSENFNIVGKSDISLSNSGETILLKDVRGQVIDSVKYSPKWHNKNFVSTKNISLERINPFLDSNDPSNWNSSVNQLGATPNKANSILTINNNRQTNLSVSPNPFSPDNDGFEDFCIINYNLSQQVAQVRIKIFDSKGRLVRTLLNNQPSGSSGSVIFDGRDDDGRTLRIGIYIIFLEALNDNSGVVETEKTVVVVARKL